MEIIVAAAVYAAGALLDRKALGRRTAAWLWYGGAMAVSAAVILAVTLGVSFPSPSALFAGWIRDMLGHLPAF